MVAESGFVMEAAREIRGKKKLSRQEGQELAERWRASGLIAAEYCRRHRVKLHVLRYWATQSKREEAAKGRSEFFVVAAKPSQASNEDETGPADGARRIDGSSAVVIVVPLQPGARALAETLKAVFAESAR